MAVPRTLLVLSVILACASTVRAGVNFTTLSKTLIVKATINGVPITDMSGSELIYGDNNITVQWSLNSSFAGMDTNYNFVQTKICFGAPSAVLRKWRKNDPDLSLSKTCKTIIATQKYIAAGNSTTYKLHNDVPGGLYFVRSFALNSTVPTGTAAMNAVAFGQTTNVNRTTNLFKVVAFTGRNGSITGAIIAFSLFSYLALFGFFFVERVMKKNK